MGVLQQQELTAEGRFPCRFPGCNKSFKYNGKTRRNHELSHDPPVQFDDSLLLTQFSLGCTAPSEETKAGDDVYNYNCALPTDCFLFFNFLDATDAIKEGDGARIMRQYKNIMLYCKADRSHSTNYALECLYQFFLVRGLLSQRDSEPFVWNRSVNNSGKKGANSGAPRTKRPSGAPWVNRSTHPRKSGNHVTDQPTDRPSAPHGYQCLLSHFLATLGAQEKADRTSILSSIDSCQNRVSTDQYNLTVSRAQVSTHRGRVFFEVVR